MVLVVLTIINKNENFSVLLAEFVKILSLFRRFSLDYMYLIFSLLESRLSHSKLGVILPNDHCYGDRYNYCVLGVRSWS